MATEVRSAQELLVIFFNELQSRSDLIDINEGSLNDILGGAFTTGTNEISETIISEFRKTFFETAHGPEVTGSVDDLQNLAVDHFGERFSRPAEKKATGSITLQRATSTGGAGTILAGSVVKTEKDVNGDELLFVTDSDVIFLSTDLVKNVQTTAQVAGPDSNVEIGTIVKIDSTIFDPEIKVTNSAKFAGGSNAEDDATYRETIRGLIEALAGATKSAIEGAIKSISGISIVTLIEEDLAVIEYDIGAEAIKAGASFFRIPFPVAYIADENGSSSQALIDQALAVLEDVRACGVKVVIKGATAIPIGWDGSISLNASGPNFSEFSSNPQKIIDSMDEYLNTLDIGTDFIKGDANSHILSIWGPTGTGDLTAFNTNTPIANTSVNANEKIISSGSSIDGACP